jgi:hypothetical protein
VQGARIYRAGSAVVEFRGCSEAGELLTIAMSKRSTLPATSSFQNAGRDESCIPCVAGKYSLGFSACIECAAGKYVDVAGSDAESDCIECAAGKYVDVAGSSDCGDCSGCSSGKVPRGREHKGATSGAVCVGGCGLSETGADGYGFCLHTVGQSKSKQHMPLRRHREDCMHAMPSRVLP